jgi:hypothetical protein
MRGKVGAWALFLVCLLLLSFAAATPYSKTADLALISLRLALVLLLSILLVRERWRHWDYRQQQTHPKTDTVDTILQRFRRWYYDEPTNPR